MIDFASELFEILYAFYRFDSMPITTHHEVTADKPHGDLVLNKNDKNARSHYAPSIFQIQTNPHKINKTQHWLLVWLGVFVTIVFLVFSKPITECLDSTSEFACDLSYPADTEEKHYDHEQDD